MLSTAVIGEDAYVISAYKTQTKPHDFALHLAACPAVVRHNFWGIYANRRTFLRRGISFSCRRLLRFVVAYRERCPSESSAGVWSEWLTDRHVTAKENCTGRDVGPSRVKSRWTKRRPTRIIGVIGPCSARWVERWSSTPTASSSAWLWPGAGLSSILAGPLEKWREIRGDNGLSTVRSLLSRPRLLIAGTNWHSVFLMKCQPSVGVATDVPRR